MEDVVRCVEIRRFRLFKHDTLPLSSNQRPNFYTGKWSLSHSLTTGLSVGFPWGQWADLAELEEERSGRLAL